MSVLLESGPDRRRLVISIHGIRSEGKWQDEFKEVFEPHFRFESFKYGEFKHSVGAVFWVAIELWVFVVGLIIAAIVLSNSSVRWTFWAIGVAVWGILFLAANLLGEGRRNRVVDDFLEAMDKYLAYERNPHIIAHSLGSFIVGRMLERYPHVNVGYIILMGCVLKSRYTWNKFGHRFEVVRNEVAGRDWVAAIATCLRAFVPEMGSAGIFGFKDKLPGFVRTLPEAEYDAPWRPCIAGCSCGLGTIEAPEARILNVQCRSLGHNNIARQRARLVWLPFLWNQPSAQFRKFIELCNECADLDAERKYTELNKKVSDLRQACWFWTRGKLDDYVKTRLTESMGHSPSEDFLIGTIRNLYLVINRAAKHNATPQQQRSLHPEFALLDALETSMLLS